MQTIDFIKSYLSSNASNQEIEEISIIVDKRKEKTPKLYINEELIKQNLINECNTRYIGSNKLEIIKYVKEVTQMGLKEAKEWCEYAIFEKLKFKY